MAKYFGKTDVMWVQGYINPTKSGEYYVALEAQEEILKFKIGDVEITTDYYNALSSEWESLGKDNDSWKVLYWADVSLPVVPDDIEDRVREYFGTYVE